ncbi:MAG: hypothetical protein V4662_25595 [Verrucomicrobiota bacterium]
MAPVIEGQDSSGTLVTGGQSLAQSLEDRGEPLPPASQVQFLSTLHRLAARDGRRAICQLLSHHDEAFRRSAFGPLLDTWADSSPFEALQWLHEPAQAFLHSSAYEIPPRFYSTTFRALALADAEAAARSFFTLRGFHRPRAFAAMLRAAQEADRLPEMLQSVTTHGDLTPAEHAIASHLSGDMSGYQYWLALIPEDSSRTEVMNALDLPKLAVKH